MNLHGFPPFEMSKIEGTFPIASNPDIFVPKRRPLTDGNGQEIRTFSKYMELKKQKLLRQVHDEVVPKSKIFNGVAIYVNGHTVPPASTLRQLIIENGGKYHHYFANKDVTYIIASAIATSKWKVLPRSALVVRPEWVVDSIKAGVRKSTAEYALQPTVLKKKPYLKMGQKMAFGSRDGGYSEGASYERQLLITNFTDTHRRNQLFSKIREQKRREQENEKRKNEMLEKELRTVYGDTHFDKHFAGRNLSELVNCKKKIDTSVRKRWETPRIFAFGRKPEEPTILFIDKVAINYTEKIDGHALIKLKETYSEMLEQSEHGVARASLRFLERVVLTSANAHRDWLLATEQLKKWANSECERLYQAQLI